MLFSTPVFRPGIGRNEVIIFRLELQQDFLKDLYDFASVTLSS